MLPLELLELVAIRSGSLYLACAIKSRHALGKLLDRSSSTRLPCLDAKTLFWALQLPEIEMGHIAWPKVAQDACEWPMPHRVYLLRHVKLDWGYEAVLQLGYESQLWVPCAINTETVEAWLYNRGCTKSKLSFIERCFAGWDSNDQRTLQTLLRGIQKCLR